MCARCFPTTTEVVVTSSLTKPRTLISTGLSVSNSKYTGARVPNRVPVDRLAGAVREAVNPATMRVSEWRDPDSNRGHHDFQSWPGTSLTATKSLQRAGVIGASGTSSILAVCTLLTRVWAPRCDSVPNRGRSANDRRAAPATRAADGTGRVGSEQESLECEAR